MLSRKFRMFDDFTVAEVYVMYKTVKFAAECCLRKIILESDSEKLDKILMVSDNIFTIFKGLVIPMQWPRSWLFMPFQSLIEFG